MVKKKSISKMTLDKLAEITARSFDDIGKRMATKTDLSDLENRLTERLDRIEHLLLLRDHLNRIEKLEDAVRMLKTKASVR